MANSLLDPEQQEAGSSGTSGDELEKIPTAPRPGSPNDYPGRKPYEQPNNVDVQDGEPTYDRPGNQPEGDKSQSGGSPPDNQRSPWKPWQRNKQPDSGSPKDEASNLRNKEGSSSKNGGDQKAQGNERSLYRPSTGDNSADSKNKILNKLFGTRKKKLIGLGGSTGIIIGLIFGFSVVQGPLQLIHLSQILGKNDSHNEKTISTRMKGLYRFARTNDVAETRLGKVGSIVYNNARSSLSNIGIEFQTDNRGVIKSVSFDATKNPELKNLSFQQRIDFLKKTYIADGNKTLKVTGTIGNPNNFVIDDIGSASFKDIKYSEFILRTSISKLENGKIISGMDLRYLKKAFNLPKLFSPWEKVSKVARAKVYDTTAAKIAEQNRLKALKPPETTKIGIAKTKVKNVLEQNQGKFTVALIGTTGLCLVRSIANDAVVVNRALIVVPATVQAVDKIAAGSQVQAGQASLADIGAMTQSFTDSNGKTIFDAAALRATAGGLGTSGEDLPVELAQAFSGKTKADNIRQAIEVNVPGTNIGITDAACSKTGVIIQAAAGIFVLLTAIPTGGASVGAWIASNTAMAVATAGVVMLLQHELGNLIKGNAVLPDALSGPLGGNVLAYAAREKTNINARSTGGVELSDQESQQIDTQQAAADQKEFSSKSLLAKLFDVHDYRSVASRLIDKSSPNINQNLAKMGNMFTNFGNIFSVFSGLLTPLAHADAQPYVWASPRYGIPQSVLDNPAYADPYDNAEQVAQLIKGDPSLKDRAQKCFGVTIDNTGSDHLYSVVANADVNPSDDIYNDADCSSTDPNWQRVMLFVLDSRISDATSCYGGDEQICSELGFGSNTNTGDDTEEGDSPDPPTSEGGVPVKGTLALVQPPNFDSNKKDRFGYYLMPPSLDGAYSFGSATPESERYGQKEMIFVLYTVAQEMKKRYPKAVMNIGDLNAIPGHVSHKVGRDVDLDLSGFDTKNQSFFAADRLKQDYSPEITIELGQLFMATGYISDIFWCDDDSCRPGGDGTTAAINSFSIQEKLGGKVSDWPNHANHFHVRLNLPPGTDIRN